MSLTPSSDDIQDMASRWSHALSTASKNLVDFSASELCLLVKARLRPDHHKAYKGATLAKGAAARSELDALLQDYLPLARVVESAQELANKSGRLFNHDKQVYDLLTGKSVMATHDTADAHGSRDLLQGARPDDFLTPTQALDLMKERFAKAHDDFMAISQAQKAFQERLASFEHERGELASKAPALDLSAERFSIDESDPLSSLSSIEEARATLRQAAAEIQAKMDESAKCAAELEKAGVEIMALRSMCARNSMAVDEARERLSNPAAPQPCATQEALAFLDNWRAKLDSTAQAGRYAACLVGSAKLRAAISDQSSASSRSYAHNRRELDELADLLGRFEAFSAKSFALRARGVLLSVSLGQLQEACRAGLAGKPANLASLNKLVAAFEAATAALGS